MEHPIQGVLAKLSAAEWIPVTVARVLTGVFFCISGGTKLLVPSQFSEMQQTLMQSHIPFPHASALFVSLVEFPCGAGLIIGLLTQLCAVLLMGDMIVAILTNRIGSIHASEFLAFLDDFLYLPEVLYVLILFSEAASEEHTNLLEAGRQSRKDLNKYIEGLLERCAKHPGPGMLSAMVNDSSEERLSKGELVSNAILLLFAGHETTVNLIAHSVLILLRNPDALEKLRRRTELVVPGIEEFLRLESSVQFWPTRTALEDIEIDGTTIPKGSPIIVVYASGNRDPKRFTNPDEVDLERPDNEHLGFSGGIHLCFGGPLARLEAQIAVSEFVRRVVNPRLVVDPPPYRHNQVFRGPRHLMVDIDGIHD